MQTDTLRGRQALKQTGMQTDTLTDRHADTLTGRQTDSLIDRHADRHIDRQACRQAHKQNAYLPQGGDGGEDEQLGDEPGQQQNDAIDTQCPPCQLLLHIRVQPPKFFCQSTH